MQKYDIAAFVWPSYTGDEPRTRIFWPEGYGEWQTVKAMTNDSYKGSRWPRKPLWGYVNEADPRVMEMQIACAKEYGVNVFIYDWYWFDDRPFLENCLNDGFLQARNNRDMQFYLMWANHHATHLWDKRNSSADLSTVIWQGSVTPAIFDRICERTIEKYFKLDNYYQIDGCPVYMIFDVDNFLRSFPDSAAARDGIETFRRKCVQAGFKGLHLQLVHWGRRRYAWLPEGDPCHGMDAAQLYAYLGIDSVTVYNWGSVCRMDGDYAALTDDYMLRMTDASQKLPVPFYPNLTIGWDNNVRFTKFVPGVVENNTPEAFKAACETIRSYTDDAVQNGSLRAALITVNSWNEWTETSYLQPDDLYGYGYLEAIRDTFLAE